MCVVKEACLALVHVRGLFSSLTSSAKTARVAAQKPRVPKDRACALPFRTLLK